MIVFLTGSGISADSGIATFRDKGGLWHKYDVREVCDMKTFEQNKDQVFAFYNDQRREYANAKPNSAHLAIARLQQQTGHVKIITQNIDQLFEQAGCHDVVHIHGNLNEMICLACEKIHVIDNEDISPDDTCPFCQQARLKPNVVFFNEGAHMQPMLEILETMTSDDVLVVIGTSGMAIPLNALVEAVPGYKILNNLTPSDDINEELFDQVIYQQATKAVDQIVDWAVHES
ncbi:MAG: NAD-dependent deacetylase [Methylococcales bacterium]|nr:NAD-dependent deacetylase [Methylococcales bacterium]